ncbi:MAG: GDP-L-fucose synthase [Alphaproteobacteria bacterium]|nr:GDP-L-fucose synthase [Alphaproteobacteria bacterium]
MTPVFSLEGKRVWVAGHRGLVGSAVCRRLADENCTFLLASRAEVDLRRQDAVEAFVRAKKPDVVVVAAARVGGIYANTKFPASFLYENLAIETNIIDTVWRNGVEKLLFLGSSCIYPREAPQPIREDDLLGGPLEPTNEWYAIAKIAGLKLCQAYRREHGCDFITAMPCNLYGPRDNFNPDTAHVIPALMLKARKAKEAGEPFVVWGSGTPRREFMYVDDLADALVFLLKHYSAEKPVNVGCGRDISIRDLAENVANVVGYEGELSFDPSRPDGVPRKIMDSSRLFSMGWRPSTTLEAGLAETWSWYQSLHNERYAA